MSLNASTRTRLLSARVRALGVAMATGCLMFVFEAAKQALHPKITIWTSHTVMILFATLVAAVVSFTVLRKENRSPHPVSLPVVTSRQHKAMESQLRQAQKLEAIGQLAAGIAHEINTPTQFASDNLTFLRDSWKSLSAVLEVYRSAIADAMASGLTEQSWSTIREAERKEDLEFIASEIPRAIEQALDGVRRVAKIVRAMKEFSHPDSGEKALVDINKAIETTITVARNEWKYVAEIETRLCPGLPLVPCHVGELNQVILNLIVNAAHAIKDKIKDGQKGMITLCTSAKGDFAEIAITDTGSGIPEAIRSKVFDPFFTTKEVGKGTGQGLALAHSTIVKKYAGKIWFETEIGQGTTFFIHLPLHAPGGEQEP